MSEERITLLKHLDERRREDEGFTLIELMVVVLIMGILMAIAIPTFLSTQNSANDSSAQSNVTNAVTNLASYYASNQQFADATASLDPSLPWTASATFATGKVTVEVGTFAWAAGTGTFTAGAAAYGTNTGSAFVVVDPSKSGNCYWSFTDENLNPPVSGYMFQTCAATPPTALPTIKTPTAGHAAQNKETGSGTTWYTGW
jgi:type IV pilus assembly protein PilA